MTMIIHNQRGSEKLHSLIGFSILLIILFLGFSFGVPYFKNMSLETYAQKLVDYDYHNHKPSQEGAKSIYERVIREGKSRKLNIDPEKVSVDYDTHKYELKMQYEQHVNLLVTQYTWMFDMHKQSRPNR
jgi:hypothetical protein